jgi:hypothetical protein
MGMIGTSIGQVATKQIMKRVERASFIIFCLAAIIGEKHQLMFYLLGLFL